jgi:pyruvate dehydrogenase (quinone)
VKKPTAADVFVDHLINWGIKFIFGIPGDGINGIMEALRTRQDRIRFIQVRHEESAALAAVGYGKFSGELGACVATTGPGAIHLLNGLYDAKSDQIPVLAITGLPYHDLLGTHYQQDVATDRLFSDVAAFSERVMGPAHVESVVAQAVRVALSKRTVAHIAFPNDFQDQPAIPAKPSKMNEPGHVSTAWQPALVVPPGEAVRRAAAILNAGHRVAIVVGSGARGAAPELEETAELLSAPMAKALLGKDVFPDDSPYSTGTIGVLGTSATAAAMASADTLLLIGTSFPYISYLPKPGWTRGIQIDLNPERIGLRFPVEEGLVGDARETLRLLIPLLERKADRSFLQGIQGKMTNWRRLMESRGTSDDIPMRPQTVAWELGRQLNDDAIICGDSGQNTVYAARHFEIRGTQRYSCSGLLATMGCGLPYAIGAQLRFPGRQVVAFVGDGGFSMTMAELATCVKYKLPVKIFILKNNTLGMIRWEQMMFLGNPEFGTQLQDIDFVKVAEGFGIKARRVDKREGLSRVVSETLAHPGPALVEAVVDPDEPLMPGKIKPEQAAKYAEALKKGQPNAHRIALTLFRDSVEDLDRDNGILARTLTGETPSLISKTKS